MTLPQHSKYRVLVLPLSAILISSAASARGDEHQTKSQFDRYPVARRLNIHARQAEIDLRLHLQEVRFQS
jgi:hypothetical protein